MATLVETQYNRWNLRWLLLLIQLIFLEYPAETKKGHAQNDRPCRYHKNPTA